MKIHSILIAIPTTIVGLHRTQDEDSLDPHHHSDDDCWPSIALRMEIRSIFIAIPMTVVGGSC